MKTPPFTKMLNPVLMALLFMMAGMFWSGKTEACGVKASFKDSVSGTIVYFKSTSTISVKHFSYTWHFGDGYVSDTAYPTHDYMNYSKSYTACLIVYDSVNKCADTACTTVTTGKAPCSAKATFTYKNGTGGKVVFTNGSSTGGGAYKSTWDFNDKTSSTDKNPTHTYSTGGYYHICLTVTDSADSSCTASYCAYDSVPATSSCTAHFVFATTKLAVVLADSGSSALSHKHSVVWNYGDGSSYGSGDNAYHTYSKAGTYSVCVVVYDSSTGCSAKYCNNVTVAACNISSSFTYGGAGNTFYFKSTSTTSSHTKYKWYFGDGSVDSTTGSGVSHKYIATDTTETVYLLIYDSTSGCSAYSYQTVTLCPTKSNYTYNVNGLTVSFAANTSNKGSVRYSWNFGDKSALSDSHAPNHTFGSNGTYNVCLTATDSITGCTSTTCTNITVSACNLTASFTDSVSGHTVKFYGTSNLTSKHSTIKWYFGDGSVDSTSGLKTSHTYGTSVTTESVTLRIYDSTSKCLVYATNTVTISCPALSDYTYSVSGLTVSFKSDSKNNSNASYIWDFNDKSDSRSANPTHSYSTNGTYNVCLTVTDSATGCSTTTCHSITVSNCSLTASITDSISGQTAYFSAVTNASSHSKITWIFGDGSVDSTSGVITHHTYGTGISTENVYLRVYDSTTKCLLYVSDTVKFCPALSDYTYSVSGLTVSFKSDSKNNSNAKYIWDFNDKSDSRSANPTHTYSAGGTYNVCLTVTDSATGCSTTTCHSFTVSGCTLTASFTDSVSGHTVYFYGSTNASSHYRIIWIYGDGSIDSSATAGLHSSHSYASTLDSAIAYMRVYDSATKCLVYTSKVVKLGVCNLSASFTDSIDNFKVKFYGRTNASSHVSVKWYFGDGAVDSTSGLNTSHTYATGTASENVYLRIYDSTTKCLAYYSSTVSLSHCILGTVTTSKTAGYPAKVYLIEYNATDSSLTAVDSTLTNSKGGYEFCGLVNGTYYTKAALTDSNTYYKDFIPTYHNDATKWSTAVKIVIYNSSDSNINIAMKLGTNPGGAGFIGGKISAGANKTGDPEVGILVVLYDSTGNPVAYTYSNILGRYSFAGIAFGTYQVWGEVPGKTCIPAIVTINDTATTDNDVNLSVNLTTVTAALKPMALTLNVVTAHVFPNPVSNKLNISLNMKYAEPVNVKIYDATGKVVSEMNANISGGAQTMEMDASSLPSGLYFLRMEMIKNNTLMEARFVKAR